MDIIAYVEESLLIVVRLVIGFANFVSGYLFIGCIKNCYVGLSNNINLGSLNHIFYFIF